VINEVTMKAFIVGLEKRALLFSLLFSCWGCASFTSVTIDSKSFPRPISMTSDIDREYRVIQHFKKAQKVPFLFLVRLSPEGGAFNLNEELQNEPGIMDGDALVNTTIKGQAAIGDVALPIVVGIGGGLVFPPLFLFLACPFYEDLKTYTIEGDIVKYVGGQRPPAEEIPNPVIEKIPPVVEHPAPVKEKSSPLPEKRIDPETGLPVKKTTVRFDPNTGLPIKEE
jgi:hypothetical protein